MTIISYQARRPVMKKTALKGLPKKAVPAKKAEQVKGGRKDKLATNHNQVTL
jgi:hypothetical protein